MSDESQLRKITTPQQRIAWVITALAIGIAVLAIRDAGMNALASSGSAIWIAIALVVSLFGFLALRFRRRRARA